jgi:predicted RNase H-related nuclease YkuK (DUF458 family)
MKDNNGLFNNPSKGELTASEMVDEVADFVAQKPELNYRLVIGTDSQAKRINGESRVDYVSAIVIHGVGRGGRYFWRKTSEDKEVRLRDKIYQETLLSLNIAQELVPELRNAVSPSKYDLEIHIDVGSLGPTREMIREVVGMVTGNGFTAKTKPESWAASSVADKHA